VRGGTGETIERERRGEEKKEKDRGREKCEAIGPQGRLQQYSLSSPLIYWPI